MTVKIYFSKVNQDAVIPTKREEDAGYDIYSCFDEDYLVIEPFQTVKIPTEIASAFSNDYFFQLKERGSSGVQGIGQRAGVIDASFRGGWLVPVTNHNPYPIIIAKKDADLSRLDIHTAQIYPYEKAIAQAVLLPVPKTETIEVPYDELWLFESKRGTGMLGSSGK